MAIRIKVAETAKELEDVYRLRYKVYVEEEGYFSNSSHASKGMIVDQFDSFPLAANIIAYEGATPIATMRVNFDEGGRLPPEEIHDFSACRENALARSLESGRPARLASAGMLAIAGRWRHRRDLFRALFKLAASLGELHGTTDIIATVNAKAEAIYRRFGFTPLGEKIWVDEIGEYVIPMECDFARYRAWAFGHFEDHKMESLNMFASSIQRLVLSAGETLFREGDAAEEAYIVDEGVIRISRHRGRNGKTLTLMSLRSGDVFGELALIDESARSADAVAVANTQLIILPKAGFEKQIESDPGKSRIVLKLLADRLRHMDDLAMVLAYGSERERLDFVLESLRERAVEDPNRPGWHLIKMGVSEIARMAGVDEALATEFINERVQAGEIEIGSNRLRFRVRKWMPLMVRSG